jgi:hypothetical protein
MCGFSRRPGCIEIIIKLGGKTLALLSKRYYLTHKSNGAYRYPAADVAQGDGDSTSVPKGALRMQLSASLKRCPDTKRDPDLGG